jgi:hypothetical protein
MAKKTAKKRRGKAKPPKMLAVASLATPESGAEPVIPVVVVPPGGSLTVLVDVGPMAVPYTISYVGRTLIKGLVDRAEDVSLQPGDQVLGWAFAHTLKDWHHTVAISLNGGAPQVLEARSEANKDQDHSVNFAIVRA